MMSTASSTSCIRVQFGDNDLVEHIGNANEHHVVVPVHQRQGDRTFVRAGPAMPVKIPPLGVCKNILPKGVD